MGPALGILGHQTEGTVGSLQVPMASDKEAPGLVCPPLQEGLARPAPRGRPFCHLGDSGKNRDFLKSRDGLGKEDPQRSFGVAMATGAPPLPRGRRGRAGTFVLGKRVAARKLPSTDRRLVHPAPEVSCVEAPPGVATSEAGCAAAMVSPRGWGCPAAFGPSSRASWVPARGPVGSPAPLGAGARGALALAGREPRGRRWPLPWTPALPRPA